jgi:signal transduction histidine kinase
MMHISLRRGAYQLGTDTNEWSDNQREFSIDIEEGGKVEIVTNDKDLIASRKLLYKYARSISKLISSLVDSFEKVITSHSHNLSKIKGQLQQKMEQVVDDLMLSKAPDYQSQRTAVIESITADPALAADVLIYLQKRAFEIGAHITSFELAHQTAPVTLSPAHHNIRRVILNVLHIFHDEMNEQNITISLKFSDLDAQENKVHFDYSTVYAALYNLVDNLIKYARPYTDLRFYFEPNSRIVISTISVRIEHRELEDIFTLGFRGEHAKDGFPGTGVGMFVVRRALEKNGMKIKVEPDYAQCERINDTDYILNKFIIELPNNV